MADEMPKDDEQKGVQSIFQSSLKSTNLSAQNMLPIDFVRTEHVV